MIFLSGGFVKRKIREIGSITKRPPSGEKGFLYGRKSHLLEDWDAFFLDPRHLMGDP
jgi:hypothetical protein